MEFKVVTDLNLKLSLKYSLPPKLVTKAITLPVCKITSIPDAGTLTGEGYGRVGVS